LLAQVVQSLGAGNATLAIAPAATKALQQLLGKGLPLTVVDGTIDPAALRDFPVDAVALHTTESALRAVRQALAEGNGPIIRLISTQIESFAWFHERAICVDTTAAGGNASLLATTG
jgi:RHH-type proline utilization regulon transcriptional repressor/proline dehydrogenase/delta 1-pyrroline-5-carboxylate dehydrogenase